MRMQSAWLALHEAFLRSSPVDVLEKGFYVVCALEPIVDHEGVLEHVQNQYGETTGEVPRLMLVDPLVDQSSSYVVLIQDSPTDAAHCPGALEILFPALVTAEVPCQLLTQLTRFVRSCLTAE